MKRQFFTASKFEADLAKTRTPSTRVCEASADRRVTNTNMKTTAIMTALALGLSAATTFAQDAPRPPRGERPPPGEGGPRGPGGFERDGQRPPLPPIIAALDANRDGVIDAKEIANASAALRTLDKNGDGQLTPDEIRPPRPEFDPEGRGPRRDLAPGEEGARRPGRPRPEQ